MKRLNYYLATLLVIVAIWFCFESIYHTERSRAISQWLIPEINLPPITTYEEEEAEKVVVEKAVDINKVLEKLGLNYDKAFESFINEICLKLPEVSPGVLYSLLSCKEFCYECYERKQTQIDWLSKEEHAANFIGDLVNKYGYSLDSTDIKLLNYFASAYLDYYRDNQDSRIEDSVDVIYLTFLSMHDDTWSVVPPEPLIVYYNNFY